MKIKFFFTIALSTLLFFSCEDSAKKIIEVNDAITTAYNNVYYDSQVLGDKLSEVIDAGREDADFKGFSVIREKFKTTVDENLKKIEAVENFGGSEAYKTAVVDYLKYMQELNDFVKKIESFTAETNENEITSWFNELDQKVNLENALINKVHTTQKDFATKNKLELTEEK